MDKLKIHYSLAQCLEWKQDQVRWENRRQETVLKSLMTMDNRAPVGEVGDIAVHVSTPALFKEYLNDPERTSMQFRGEYYVTGDRAKMDEDGYFWFEGRGDDIIISSGYTIGPFEVEEALLQHTGS